MTTHITDGQSPTRASRRAGGQAAGPPTPPGPIGDRLPVSTRQRRPALAALAVVLILGGAALAATLVLTSGQKQQYLLVNRDIAIGQTLTREDFLLQSISATNSAIFAPVPGADFYPRVNGRKALTEMKKGSLLTEGTFGDVVTPGRGLTELSLLIPEGQYTDGLAAGDVVKVLHTPRANAQTSPDKTEGQKPMPRGYTLIRAAYVIGVRSSSGGQNAAVITIRVNNLELDKSSNYGLPVLAAGNAYNAISVIRIDPTSDYDKGAK